MEKYSFFFLSIISKSALLYYTLLYFSPLYSTVLYCTLLYSTVLTLLFFFVGEEPPDFRCHFAGFSYYVPYYDLLQSSKIECAQKSDDIDINYYNNDNDDDDNNHNNDNEVKKEQIEANKNTVDHNNSSTTSTPTINNAKNIVSFLRLFDQTYPASLIVGQGVVSVEVF